MFSPCLALCLLAGLLRKLWVDLDETEMNNSLSDKEQLIRWW